EVPPVRRDRVSHSGSGRHLLQFSGVSKGCGFPPQWSGRSRDHHCRSGRCDEVNSGPRPLASRGGIRIKSPQNRNNYFHGGRNMLRKFSVLLAGAVSALALAFGAQAQEIKIGFSMSLTGPLSANGKQALLGMQIWEEEINSKGGLL